MFANQNGSSRKPSQWRVPKFGKGCSTAAGVATLQYPTPGTNIGTEMVLQEGILPTIHYSFLHISTECERRTMCSGVRNV